jgi:hypothetical protein
MYSVNLLHARVLYVYTDNYLLAVTFPIWRHFQISNLKKKKGTAFQKSHSPFLMTPCGCRTCSSWAVVTTGTFKPRFRSSHSSLIRSLDCQLTTETTPRISYRTHLVVSL